MAKDLIFGIAVLFFFQTASAEGPSCTLASNTDVKPDPWVQEILVQSRSPSEQYVHRLYQRLTGRVLSNQDSTFKRVQRLVESHQYLEAAQLVVKDPHFLQTRVRNFAAPFGNKDFSPDQGFNDLQALIIGIIRDQEDARKILTGNFRYVGNSTLGLPAPSVDNNRHYQAFESENLSYRTGLLRTSQPLTEIGFNSGVFTTRTWGEAHYKAGTNRRSVQYAFEAFLCYPIESWKTFAAPDYFVRRDVGRTPGGDPVDYQTRCRSCHSIMDGLGGAFARFDFADQKFVFHPNAVAAKMNQNESFYPEGYVTIDDSWTNLLSLNPTIDFGWPSKMSGTGVRDFAEMLANSGAFSRCLVQKVFTEICGATALEHAYQKVQEFAVSFQEDNYNLQNLFSSIAATRECLSHTGGSN